MAVDLELESCPFLAVSDMQETVRWYQRKLGFEGWWEDGEGNVHTGPNFEPVGDRLTSRM